LADPDSANIQKAKAGVALAAVAAVVVAVVALSCLVFWAVAITVPSILGWLTMRTCKHRISSRDYYFAINQKSSRPWGI
jgi:hypothetical protein